MERRGLIDEGPRVIWSIVYSSSCLNLNESAGDRNFGHCAMVIGVSLCVSVSVLLLLLVALLPADLELLASPTDQR